MPMQLRLYGVGFEFYTTRWYVLGRDANVTKAVQDKTLCNAGREGLD